MVVLGSTGSIGVNTLILAERHFLPVEVLVAGQNADLLQSQIDTFAPKTVVVADEATARKLNHPDVRFGEAAILQAIEESRSDLVVNALVGFLGLRPTLSALACGKRVALANKESLVVAGQFIDTSRIIPIDSEHFGLWYLLSERRIRKMSITASGGAFRDWDLEKIAGAGLEDVLKHPNWSMGQKITIDSATMVNKLFELIEAHWLFRGRFDGEPRFDALIETRSIIHALIDFADGSTTAHMAYTDMKLPIAFALGLDPQEAVLEPVDLVEVGRLEFRKITPDRYGIWEIKDDCLRRPQKGAIINAANEAAIELFLEGRCGFLDIARLIKSAYETYSHASPKNLDDVFAIDKEVRAYVRTSC